jgi:hypothetical protein
LQLECKWRHLSHICAGMKYIIYKTTNKLNGRFYIGKHKCESLAFDGYLGSGRLLLAAVKKYCESNFERETLAVYESQEDMDAAEFEIVCADFLRENSGRCYNLAIGGKGGFHILDDESRMPVNIAKLPHIRKKISANGVIAQNRPEVRRKKSESQLGEKNHRYGKKISAEHSAKISAVHTGRIKSSEERAKLSASMMGHVISVETANKIRIANTGKVQSLESRKKRALSHLGKKHSAETIAKMSAAKTGYVHELLICPHCQLQGRGPNMSRYHFNKCKHKA